jgi:hypothetical protein
MQVLTLINKIRAGISNCKPVFSNMMLRMFREIDTDDVFSGF